MPGAIYTKVGGAWKLTEYPTGTANVKVGGTWRPCIAVWIKVGGVWKQAFGL